MTHERFWQYARKNDGTAAPLATITVYNSGTLNLATIWSDQAGIALKANPFVSDADAYFFFYAAAGRYDVKVSGTGVTNPYTWSDLLLIDRFDAAYLDVANVFTENQTIQGTLTVTGALTLGSLAVALVTAEGKLASLDLNHLANLDASALTGLNASALASGSVPNAQLSGTYDANPVTISNALNILRGQWIAAGGANVASAGALRLGFNDRIIGRNGANTADVPVLAVNTTDFIELLSSVWARALAPLTDDAYNLGNTTERWRNGHIKDLHVASVQFMDSTGTPLGGGAAPTLGTIGGAGPVAAAQAGWRLMLDSAGAGFWVPFWR